MPKVKNGDTFTCNSCGLMVEVTDACDCADCGIVCCEAPMERSSSSSRSSTSSAKRRKNNGTKRGRRNRR